MAYANVLAEDDVLLAFLIDDLLAEEEEMDIAMMILAQGGGLLREEEERHQKPTRIKDYVEHTVLQYNNQEFKAHFRMERGTFEVSMLFSNEKSILEKILV